MSLLDEIPGYREAILEERGRRELAFLGLPDEVGGYLLRPLTFRDLITLNQMGNPLMEGGDVTDIHLAQFLRLQSWETRRAMVWWQVSLLFKDTEAITLDFMEWIGAQFEDSPASSGVDNGASPYSWVAGYITALGAECGFSMKETMDLPVRAAFQISRCIEHRNNPKKTFFNPSDKARTRWLQRINAQN